MAHCGRMSRLLGLALALLAVAWGASAASAGGQVGTSLPADFPVILDSIVAPGAGRENQGDQ